MTLQSRYGRSYSIKVGTGTGLHIDGSKAEIFYIKSPE
jgi:hypothetical protein